MADKKIDLKEELREMHFDMDFMQRIDCTYQENLAFAKMKKDGFDLPDGVFEHQLENSNDSSGFFYRIYDPGLTDAEKQEYLQYKQYQHIKTIKNCVVFFTVLTVISLILSLIYVLFSILM